MKWYTCTPMDFGGGPGFFGRDSGLMCRGLQAHGVNARAVMIGGKRADDEPDLIRTTLSQMEDPEWWRAQSLDGVLLYAWGSPRFRKVARAIRLAGVTLVLNQDSSGWISPLAGWRGWLQEQKCLSGLKSHPGGLHRFASAIAKGLGPGLLRTDPLRAMHLKQGDRIACVTPAATEVYRRLCGIYGGKHLAAKVMTLPHPVNPLYRYSGTTKEKRIIAVGRWDAKIQKRPEYLLHVMASLVKKHPNLHIDIVGKEIPEFQEWSATLTEEEQERVKFHGYLTAADLLDLYGRSRVLYCPSSFESFHIASGEALCCGCSVVGADSPSLPGFPWFVNEGSGQLAKSDDPDGHEKALHAELEAWDGGDRDPFEISSRWMKRLHAPQVAKVMLDEFTQESP